MKLLKLFLVMISIAAAWVALLWFWMNVIP